MSGNIITSLCKIKILSGSDANHTNESHSSISKKDFLEKSKYYKAGDKVHDNYVVSVPIFRSV